MVEVIVPQLRRVPPGETARVFTLDPDHVGIETFNDLVGQIAWSHHWIETEGHLVHHSALGYRVPQRLGRNLTGPVTRCNLQSIHFRDGC